MMEFNFTFKGMDSSPAIAQYAEKKLSRLERYFYGPVQAQIVLKREKFREIAEIVLNGDGETLVVKEETDDIYSSIDFAYESLEKQVKRLKEKRQEHRPPRVQGQTTLTETSEEVLVSKIEVVPLSTQEALNLFKKGNDKIYLFFNTDEDKICCFYRENNKIFLYIPEMS
ncbi:glyceraldehyde-3-phosphate dehydrogenase [Caldimicrobium thiodismutans]|jgi:putative sigma-54 modulation protein|uniref:Ribosome hibernation promoting factor n=1 Tax=Caldimicrobium thiodismutans TaxID=1653476 RepID=A0A0U4W1B5_9BACT|nr:ribosome-associated translation inhibitor RaiA [Caldimicrobium thiodismutans]BAU22941.1 glyceraldehyde-3-phosphate dehydrogenase [Caldimicrobium thiodismutans]